MNEIQDTVESISQKLRYLYRLSSLLSMKADDAYSLGLLQTLIVGYPLVPFTGSSIRPFCLTHIINDITVNERKCIIEFGSGISTILIGRLILKNNLQVKFFTVEHDQRWVNTLNEILKRENLNEVVHVIHAPLSECDFSVENNTWYDSKILASHFERVEFDMAIIDGPPAWEVGKGEARYPALPFLFNKMMPDCSIYLDDANRPGELAVIKKWEAEFGIEFCITGETLGFCYIGDSYFTEPIVYY